MTLTATDNLSGVQNTYYILDGGTQQTYAASFNVSGDAAHSLSYWSVDAAGNVENAKTLAIDIDATPPMISISAPPPQAPPADRSPTR